MKVYEIIQEDLDEASLKTTALAGLAAGSLLGALTIGNKKDEIVDWPSSPSEVTSYEEYLDQGTHTPKQEVLAAAISATYRINKELAQEVVDLAFKYEKADFPKAVDILAVIGVESSFNPRAVSSLKKDPAVGLMQVRPRIWGLDPNHLRTDLETQIESGAKILNKYYSKLQNKDAAIQAYNIGITSYRKGNKNPRYLQKYYKEINRYEDII